MVLRRPAEYVAALRDDRTVYFRGARVGDVTTHAVIGRGVAHACLDFELAHDPSLAAVTTVDDGSGGRMSRYFAPPRGADDLLARSRLIETATARGRTLVPLVKEIGTDALFALGRVAPLLDELGGDDAASSRIAAFARHCREGDLTMAVAQTDVKGDRSLGPSAQPNPDSYLRIVERRSDGVVVRGAKVHTSCAPYVDELIVLPTRAMGPADADHAVAFAIPVATPGLTLVASPYGSHTGTPFEAPLSAERQMIETVTIFDDVFVPSERVFLAGQHALAGPLALAFVDYHRFTAISYKLPLVDALVGSALLLADLNGLTRAGHVREKCTWLISYAETLRALVEMAALRARPDERSGLWVPDPLTVNIAKSHFAHGYHQALQHVQDVAGGLLVTGPAGEDFANEATGPLLRHYLGGRAGVDGETRMRALHMVSDLTTGEFGGYHAVLAIHAEGSLEAEKLQTFRAYPAERAVAYARWLAGLDGGSPSL